MKSVRRSERMRRRLAHQIRSRGIPHKYRPNQSPTLYTTKWSELKRSGCIAGFVETIDIVMVGKTDCRAQVMSLLPNEVITMTHKGDNEYIGNGDLIYDVPACDTQNSVPQSLGIWRAVMGGVNHRRTGVCRDRQPAWLPRLGIDWNDGPKRGQPRHPCVCDVTRQQE